MIGVSLSLSFLHELIIPKTRKRYKRKEKDFVVMTDRIDGCLGLMGLMPQKYELLLLWPLIASNLFGLFLRQFVIDRQVV